MTDGAAVLAAVDCGTNSTRLLVVGPSGDQIAREMTITRLGEAVDSEHRLRPSAMDRTYDVLRTYRKIMDGAGVRRARLVATSAVRDAANGNEFLRTASRIVGVPAEVLSGEEEGALTYLGATNGLPPAPDPVVVDIGGGSTELVTRVDDTTASVSMNVGCVRVTERYLRSDPPTAGEVDEATRALAAEFDRAAERIPSLDRSGSGQRLVGVAGTVSTLVSLEIGIESYDRERIHHFVLTEESVARWCRVLGAEAVAARLRRRGLPEGRADVIFGGALILREVMRRFGFRTCTASEDDILDGLVASVRH